jgi:nucleoid DNA-binding protein
LHSWHASRAADGAEASPVAHRKRKRAVDAGAAVSIAEALAERTRFTLFRFGAVRLHRRKGLRRRRAATHAVRGCGAHRGV